MYNVKIG